MAAFGRIAVVRKVAAALLIENVSLSAEPFQLLALDLNLHMVVSRASISKMAEEY